MRYEELHNRYGSHVAERVRGELTQEEFNEVLLDNLPQWLEQRAEEAHNAYRRMLSNPLASSEVDHHKAGEICRRWRMSEDLAYLVTIADDTDRDQKSTVTKKL